MIQLQLALDLISEQEAFALVEKVHNYIDIIEIGTPFILRYGADVVRKMRQAFPNNQILCDCKIMDAGKEETRMMTDAGADWVTVMAVTDEATIRECVTDAHVAGKKVMVDLLCYPITRESIARLVDCGADCLAVHIGVDQQAKGETPIDSLRSLKACLPNSMVAVAGGISERSIQEYLKENPDIVIVGGGITAHKDPCSAAERLYGAIRQAEEEGE